MLTAGPIQPLQGADHLSRWRVGVCAIPETRKRPRELSSNFPLPHGGAQSRELPPEVLGNRVPLGLRPLGIPLEGNHAYLGG